MLDLGFAYTCPQSQVASMAEAQVQTSSLQSLVSTALELVVVFSSILILERAVRYFFAFYLTPNDRINNYF